MEIRATDRLGRQSRVEEQTGKQKAAISGPKNGRSDHLSLSRQALAYLEEQAKAAEAEAAAAAAKQQTQEGSGQDGMLDSLERAMKQMKRCQEIARRLMAGDKVPAKDLQYLMENDPEGYKLAMAMRKVKKDPKEWESVLKDEEGESTAEQAAPAQDTAASAPSADASEGAAGDDA